MQRRRLWPNVFSRIFSVLDLALLIHWTFALSHFPFGGGVDPTHGITNLHAKMISGLNNGGRQGPHFWKDGTKRHIHVGWTFQISIVLEKYRVSQLNCFSSFTEFRRPLHFVISCPALSDNLFNFRQWQSKNNERQISEHYGDERRRPKNDSEWRNQIALNFRKQMICGNSSSGKACDVLIERFRSW